MAEIQDFGEKIGGARKDIWKDRGIIFSDLSEMNVMERKSNIKKDNIWLRPDWTKVIAEGTPQCVAYWQNLMRQAIPPRPSSDDEISQKNYVNVVGQIRDAVMAVKEPSQIDNFYKEFIRPTFIESNSGSYYVTITPEASGIVTNKVLKAAQAKSYNMLRDAKKKLFGIAKDEKTYEAVKNSLSVHRYDGSDVVLETNERDENETVLKIKNGFGRSYYYLRSDKDHKNISDWEYGTYFVFDNNRCKPLKINFSSYEDAIDFIENYARAAQKAANEQGTDKGKRTSSNRKGAFVPPQLSHIKRTGPNYRGIRSAQSDMFLNDLKFRGGEFGNWLNNNDRRESLNMAYDALRDLAVYLQIRPEDVSLGKSLAIAFGARGRGGANAGAAHYEPDRQVINLTKMSGAGCLAHEWGHALDHAIGISCGGVELATEMKRQSKLPESFKNLVHSLKYKTAIVEADEIRAEKIKKVEYSRRNLKNWIASVKPRSLPSNLEDAWNTTASRIINSESIFSGSEYMQTGRRDVVSTNPEIEILSKISKTATNHAIPRDSKRQIMLWAVELAAYEAQAKSVEPRETEVKTDFYKGSIEFDKAYSRASHGYWQSECEMFARAFDCYISDKIKESGNKSDYLTAYANSFVMQGKDGNRIAAVPLGEERKCINEKFDILLTDLKERGLLHEYMEEQEHIDFVPERKTHDVEHEIPSSPLHCEQLSLDDLLFATESRAASASVNMNQVKNKQR